jgi:hypothetical protein
VTRSSLAALACAAIALTAARSGRTAPPTKDECVDANENAQVARKQGHLRNARELFRTCVAESCPDVLRSDCAWRLAEIERSMPSVVVSALSALRNPLAEVIVSIDGDKPIAAPADGVIELDPGPHDLSFTHDGTLIRSAVNLVAGQQHVPLTLTFNDRVQEGADTKPQGGRRDATLPLVIGAFGVVGLGLGSAFGLAAISKNSASNANGHCDSSGCDSTGTGLRNVALDDARVSTVAFAAGLALVGAGAVLWLSAPGNYSTRVGVLPFSTGRDGGVLLQACW